MGSCAFDMLFVLNVPHILEKIFFYMDYESFKKCLEVSMNWNELLTSHSYQTKLRVTFHNEIIEDGSKLWCAAIYECLRVSVGRWPRHFSCGIKPHCRQSVAVRLKNL